MVKHLVLAFFLFFFCSTLPFALSEVEDAVSKLLGSDGEAADNAYKELVLLQDAAAIGQLLATDPASLLHAYAGIGFHDDRSSTVRTTEAPLGVIVLYLIDAILFNSLTPYLAPVLLNEAGGDEIAALSTAAAAYNESWIKYKELSLEELRNLTHPLEGFSNAIWLPHLPPIEDGGERNSRRHRQLEEVPNSSTPRFRAKGFFTRIIDTLDGPDADKIKDPSHLIYRPKNRGGPIPYNCLAWALGQNDRWLQPRGADGWDDILMDYDYDPTTTYNCNDKCPAKLGPKIKMIFRYKKKGTECKDSNWIHAMRMEADGQWTSKNGETSLFRNEADCDAFLKDYYKTPKKWIDEKKCFCKKKTTVGTTTDPPSTPEGGSPSNGTTSPEYCTTVEDPKCSKLIVAGDPGQAEIGSVCSNVVLDNLEVHQTITRPDCCLIESHICNLPVKTFSVADPSDCTTMNFFSIDIWDVYSFVCDYDNDEFLVAGHATVQCDSAIEVSVGGRRLQDAPFNYQAYFDIVLKCDVCLA